MTTISGGLRAGTGSRARPEPSPNGENGLLAGTGAGQVMALVAVMAAFLLFGQDELAAWRANGEMFEKVSGGWLRWNWMVALLTIGLAGLFAWLSSREPLPRSEAPSPTKTEKVY